MVKGTGTGMGMLCMCKGNWGLRGYVSMSNLTLSVYVNIKIDG